MIFLSGGTTESLRVERLLAGLGHRILVSQATEVAMDHLDSPMVEVRRGRLDVDGFCALFAGRKVSAVVDASHPFATALRRDLREACERLAIPRLRVERPVRAPVGVHHVADHSQAARVAFSLGRNVFLASGSRNLVCYVEQARLAGGRLRARMVPSEESRKAVREAHLEERSVIWATGPFTRGQHQEHFRGSQVLVAKDSGEGSGASERLEAARELGMEVVLLARPPAEEGAVWESAEVVDWIRSCSRPGS